MKIVFGLGHPAHFHLYKHVMIRLSETHDVLVVISDKDILRSLIEQYNIPYEIIAVTKIGESIFSKALKLFRSTITLYRKLKVFKPDLVIGCLSQLCWASKFLKTKCIFNAEDDIDYTFIQGFITYPFVDTIMTPSVVNVWPFSYKRISYNGYHKLAYLHPNWFIPDNSIVKQYIKEESYFIIRLVSLNAYHDINAKGLNNDLLLDLITKLSHNGKVLITSEAELPEILKPYELKIQHKDIHHILYFAKLFIGDSQSMTVEAAMLGTPSVRINNFTDKISVINELEHYYNLTYSFKPSNLENLNIRIDEILKRSDEYWSVKKQKMLSDKIDVTSFLIWFIENFPESKVIMKKNPKYQLNFK